MQLDRHLERLHERLSHVAEGDREEEARTAQRLLASLDDSVRLMLLDVLAAAAAEITRELAPGSVELRLRGGDPEFAVSPAGGAPATVPAAPAAPVDEPPAADATAGSEGALARINLRLPEQLKARVEQAAEKEGLSINAWLVRAVASVVERGRAGAVESPAYSTGQQFKGWGR